MLENVILVLNGKGGVGKSTLTANLAGLAAASGWRALGVDLDRQGNLARDLGYFDRSDNGRSLLRAAKGEGSVEVVTAVRPGLDVIAGGRELDELVAHLQLKMMQGDLAALDGIDSALRPIAQDYDVVVLDSGPGNALIHAAAINASHFIVIPTKTDDGSLDGLDPVGDVVEAQRRHNPHIEVLGVAVMFAPASATRIVAAARQKLTDLLGADLVFDTVIRSAPAIADACREKGCLAHEYEAEAAGGEKWWKALREGRRPSSSYSTAAPNLASDYEALAKEIFARFTERRAAEVR